MKEYEGDNRTQCGRMYAYFCVDDTEEQDHCAEIAREYAVPKERTYIDVYGASDERTEYEKLRAALSRGDTLVIERLDHLGDTLEDIAAEWRCITKECGAAVVAAALPEVDTRRENNTPVEDTIAALLEYVSCNTHTFQRRRQADGIAAAKARGVKFGRPRRKRPKDFEKVKEQWKSGLLSSRTAAKELGVSQSSFVRWAKEEQ